MGSRAKPPDLRRGHNNRRGSAPGSAELPDRGETIDLANPPTLPERRDGVPWLEEAAWAWEEAWASPMAVEFLPADVPRLVGYVDLIHRYWLVDHHDHDHVTKLTSLAREIRQQGAGFGLTPADRWKLHWTIDHGDGRRHGSARPSAPAPEPTRTGGTYAGLRLA